MNKKCLTMLVVLPLLMAMTGCVELADESQMAAKPVIYLYPEASGEEQMDAKPVIYLYPEENGEKPVDAKPENSGAMEVTVELDYKGELTCTYPEYDNGWQVIAKPDGTLINKKDGKEYSYLFWEGTDDIAYDMTEGFVVAGEDTADFLQEKLSYMGLTPKEYNEFIVYWLPLMESNPYNLIAFQGDVYTDHAVLKITPEPDSLLRVFMAFAPLEEKITLPEQTLQTFTREGFSVVEWGGAQIHSQ